MTTPSKFSFLNIIERVGNLLPDPTFLFIGGALLVMVLSHVGSVAGWSVRPIELHIVTESVTLPTGEVVQQPIKDARTGRPQTEIVETGEPITPYSLLTTDGLYWAFSGLIRNFINFPPLGIVITGMLGVGVAERSGLFDALLRRLAPAVHSSLITPAVIFLGICSNIASDAGYLVLPPLAAVLYLSLKRSPLVGIANAFAGVAAGFSANFLIGGSDALMAGLTQPNAQLLDPDYTVVATCNYYFMAASTVLLTLVGWAVSAWFVEPRLRARPADEGGAPAMQALSDETNAGLTSDEKRGLRWAFLVFAVMLGIVLACIWIPGGPLHGIGPDPLSSKPVKRWVASIVPLVFVIFLGPGVAYGACTGTMSSLKKVANAMVDSMRAMAPIISMSFFAAQFIAYFNYSNLGKMLAITGGGALAAAEVHPMVVIVLLIGITMVMNLLIASMSAKFALMAPIFVPMLMMLGLSPELTQCAYRLADSVTNTVSPMNSYLIVILAFMGRYAKSTGIGTLISIMTPYSIVFGIVWTIFLLLWMAVGIPLGPEGPLWYTPAGGAT